MNYRNEPCPKCQSNGKDSRGDNLVVYDNGHSHCFACHYHVFPKYYVPKEKVNHGPKSLCPADFTYEVPTIGWEWLLQYGLPYTYWKDITGYSEERGPRLVFRVEYEGHLAFSIGRLLDSNNVVTRDRLGGDQDVSKWGQGNKPHKRPSKWYVWGDSHRHCEIVGHGKGTSVTLVEDIVSAHKVGQVSECIPIFGTEIHPAHIYYLAAQRKPVTLWLDKDQELNVKKQALRLESLIDKPVQIIVTDKDPKLLSFEQISGELHK